MAEEVVPVGLQIVEETKLEISWSDDRVQQIPLHQLRKACPCATCREKQKADAEKPKGLLPVLTMAEAAPLRIVRMRPVGNYAYNVAFSDGHDSGIFTFELLRSLA